MEVFQLDLVPQSYRVIPSYPTLPVYRLLLIVISFYFWNRCYKFAKTTLFPKDSKKAARVCPLVHAIFATLGSIYILYVHEPVFGIPSSYCAPIIYCEYIFGITYGYFLWDIMTVIIEKWTIDYLIHAIFCLYVFTVCTFSSLLHRAAIIVLFYEFSTVFLHCYIFAYKFGYEKIGAILQKLFALAFIFCRIIVGVFCTIEMWQIFYFQTKNVNFECIHPFIWQSILFINALFHILNFYWFWLIIKQALGIKKLDVIKQYMIRAI